ncbi:MAG: sigma-54 dependent transcriptional regulator [Planctomycetaceae bacterium]|jgi:transcriptional regulator with PAS, ATPase and Fis domain|nr:sigma-54 dependent transcriptional regulator [Planctomycetaceae bacterium]
MKSLFTDEELTGNSEAIQGVRRLIDRIARTDSTVVILGETGTGKELVARSIHTRSLRADKLFVAVNCGALPENLIESELFGHRKGSFTGADSNRIGLLEVADGGTLFLDEIGELPKAMQAKLLRFLENGEIRKIGDNTPTHCNVRVVCATLKNLELMVNAGDFREDLWFRINTFVIKLPSLRERLEDLPELILKLSSRFRPGLKLDWSDGGKNVFGIFTKRAFERLQNYDWPGNIRQLANTLEHALVLSDKLPIDIDSLPDLLEVRVSQETTGNITIQERNADARPEVCKNAIDSNATIQTITPRQKKDSLSRLAANLTAFDPSISKPTASFNTPATSSEPELSNTNLPSSLRELEAQAIAAALQRNDGNKVKAAEELGISLKTLYNKLNLPDIKIKET